DIFFDQLSWILLLLGIGLFAGGSTILPILTNIGIGMIIYSVTIIIIFGGRKKDNIFGKIIGGVGSLYGITGYMSDILSYSRLLALGLSTAVVGMVMNMLAGMIQGSVIGFALSIIVYIIGHSFNLVMGLLSAYVHDSRLQYIEFFGKFYDGGGEKFVPLSLKLKHIKKVNL
ncbi:MAG: V-type ATPase 116kDa subunit family protein, partial [Bacilli bacterium]